MRLSASERPMSVAPIEVHEYLLCSKVALNSASVRRIFPGALIRVGNGHGCIHPWPEFGDAPLDQHLRSLLEGHPTALAAQALHCAALDGQARAAGRSLFEGLQIPRSHYSWSFGLPSAAQMKRVADEQWPALKAKGCANVGETREFLNQCARFMGDQPLGLRVDFNGCLSRGDFERFIEFMPLRTHQRLDWVEDPFAHDDEQWDQVRRRWQIRLALDKGWRGARGGFDRVVIKPARRCWREVAALHHQSVLVFTSAMDHPIGQMYAALQAALALQELGPDRLDSGGLCTQHLFEPNAFLERVQSPGGSLQPDEVGGGLGFGDLLEALPWRKLEQALA
jgi:O-succinylbenzoate synthase